MTMQDLDFSGRRVVITGAASGIGRGLALVVSHGEVMH